MTTSRSIALRNSGLVVAAVIAVVTLVAGTSTATAGSRRRVVVLDFKGPEAGKFHADVVSLVRKTHTVVSIDKWERTADDLGAMKLNSKNVQKVARKLNVDGVIVGEVEKRRDRFILRLKVREGRSGDYTGNPIEATSGKGWLDARATKDVKGELLDTIDTLDPPRSSGDDEEDRPRSRDRDRELEDEEEDRPPRSKSRDREEDRGFSRTKSDKRGRDMDDEEMEEDRPPPPRGKTKLSGNGNGSSKSMAKSRERDRGDPTSSEGEDEENPLPARSAKSSGKSSGKSNLAEDERDLIRSGKEPNQGDEEGGEARGEDEEDGDRVAAKDEGEDEDGGDVEEKLEVEDTIDRKAYGERGVDAALGVSVWRRRLGFSSQSTLDDDPQGYKGAPVAGLYFDADVYPLVFTKSRSILRHLGVTVLVDRILKIQSEINFMGETSVLPTRQYRYGAGVIFRYPLGKSATAPVIAARVRYSKMAFSIDRGAAPAGATVDVPNVGYTIVDPGLIFTLPVGTKFSITAEAMFDAMMKTGEISEGDQYGQGTVTGFEGELHADYRFTNNLFARAAFKFMTVGFSFNGNGDLSTNRDADAEQDVFGARDTYLGGFVGAGFLF